MQKLVLFVLFFAAVASAYTRWHQLKDYTFEQYMTEYNKVYSSESELAQRREVFNSALEKIKIHNSRDASWKEGVNHMTDRTPEEFKRLLGYKKGAASHLKKRVVPIQEIYDSASLPAEVDWRTKDVVTAVKDQGDCGSCWTFGTAETIESHWALATGHLEALSEQQILDCTPNPKQCGGTGGCGGGTAELAMARIIEMGGISSEWTYPYRSYFGNAFDCQFNKSNTVPMAILKDYKVLPSNHQPALMDAIANIGPMAISVDASSWQNYESGVYNGCNQTHPDIDHSVQLVGYGSSQGLDYWLVRNSWNPTWGEQGYIKIHRPANPTCGWDLTPRDGDECRNGPKEQLVCGTCGILFDTAYPIIQK